MKHRLFFAALLTAALALELGSAHAASFILSSNSSSPQTVSAGGTGTVNSGVILNITSGSNVPVTMSTGTAGSPTTLINNGTIEVTGTGSARAVASGGTNAVLVIQNNLGATIFTINNDTVAAGTGSTTVSSVALTNAGTIESAAGGQAVNFNKITASPNSIANSGLIKATGSDAVRPGVNGTVSNSGTIQSIQVSGSSSDAVDVQANTGVIVTNASNWSAGSPATPGTGLIDSGRHGITGGPATNIAFTTSITNNLGGTIRGNNGSGINFDGFSGLQTATIINGGTITGNGVTGDGDGVDVDGLVNLTNSGIIRSINAVGSTTPGQSEGISVGGGTIINSGTIEGLVASGNTNAVGRGISLLGNDITTGPLAGTREAIYGNATVTNQNGGLIRGDSDSGIAVDGPASGFTVTINNNAGAIIRGGATLAGLGGTSAAIRTGADNDTINNAGVIDGSSNGRAIDMGAGNNTLNVTGGSAQIVGDINGGGGGTNSLVVDPGTGNSFTYSGAISNFATVRIKSGTVTLGGNNSYTGDSTVEGGTLSLASPGMLTSHVIAQTGATFVHSGAIGGSGTGVTVQNGGNYFVTDSGVTGVAAFTGTGQLLDLQAGSSIFFDIGGTTRGTGYDYISGLTDFNLPTSGAPVNFVLNLLGGYTPSYGDTFDLVDSSNMPSLAGLFDFSSAPAGYVWDTSNFLVNGTVVLAPEPGRAMLLMIGLAAVGLRRRRC